MIQNLKLEKDGDVILNTKDPVGIIKSLCLPSNVYSHFLLR